MIDIKNDLPGICDLEFTIAYVEQEIRESTLETLFLNPIFTSAGDYPFYKELNENKTEKQSRILNISYLGVNQYARALPEPSKGGYDGADGEERLTVGHFNLMSFEICVFRAT